MKRSSKKSPKKSKPVYYKPLQPRPVKVRIPKNATIEERAWMAFQKAVYGVVEEARVSGRKIVVWENNRPKWIRVPLSYKHPPITRWLSKKPERIIPQDACKEKKVS